MNARRSWARAALALVVAAAAILVLVFHVPNPGISPLLAQRKPDVEHGKYVAVLGDCAACHTAAGGQPFAGGVPFSTPVGTVYSTNITPDRDSGIGNYSFEDFVRVMRLGVTPDGTRLYPAMPYTAYAKVSDETSRICSPISSRASLRLSKPVVRAQSHGHSACGGRSPCGISRFMTIPASWRMVRRMSSGTVAPISSRA
jgi:hypothetical protein